MEPKPTKKSYEQIFEFSEVAAAYKARIGNKETKLNYALTQMTGDPNTRQKGRLSDIVAEFYKKQADLRLEHAATDTDDIVLRETSNPKLYKYTKAGEQALVKALRELDVKIVDIKPFYVSVDEIPKDLTSIELEYFTGFVIQDTLKN